MRWLSAGFVMGWLGAVLVCAPMALAAADAPTPPLPWARCFLPEAPPGACADGWGPTANACDPDRFLDRAAYREAPAHAPPEFPQAAPQPVQWHIGH